MCVCVCIYMHIYIYIYIYIYIFIYIYIDVAGCLPWARATLEGEGSIYFVMLFIYIETWTHSPNTAARKQHSTSN